MKRWHKDWKVTRREWQEHWQFHVESNKSRPVGYAPFQRQVGSDPQEVDCLCDDQAGRFRKRKAFDCGKPRCQLCHGDKFPRRKLTKQERITQMRLREQILELARTFDA